MIHVYFGHGKGKTSSAFGLALRMAGHGRRVLVAQFIKDGSSGEVAAARHVPGIDLLFPSPYLTVAGNRALWTRVRPHLSQPDGYAMIVLDEVLDAMAGGALSEAELLDAIGDCVRAGIELVLTGHLSPPESILSQTDYLTRLDMLKHPYERGVEAREGVEF